MASAYEKEGIIYISWYDWSIGNNKNRSTHLRYSAKNMKLANKMAEELQKEMDNKRAEYDKKSLLKGTTIIGAFEHFLKNNSTKHIGTIRDYHRFFNLFKQTFDEDSPCTIINKLKVEDWITEVKKLPQQQNSLHGYYKQCNHFLNFLFEYNYIPMFKINKDVKIRPEVKEIIVFRDEDLKKIFANLHNKNSNFRIMIYLAYYTGLRSTDMLSILAEKVNFENNSISYYSPKIKTWLTIPIHEKLLGVLKERIIEIKSGKILDYTENTHMWKVFHDYLLELGLTDKGYSVRTFRKTFITHASAYMDLAIVSKLVGHRNITTTAKYYNKIDLTRKAIELNKFKGIESAE